MLLDKEEFIENNFFTRQFIEVEIQRLFVQKEKAQHAFEQIKAVFDKEKFEKLNESQLEEEWIKPVLQALGFAYAYQVSKKSQGKNLKPDFALFANESLKDAHYQQTKSANQDILALCESKAYHARLDNKKIAMQGWPWHSKDAYKYVLVLTKILP